MTAAIARTALLLTCLALPALAQEPGKMVETTGNTLTAAPAAWLGATPHFVMMGTVNGTVFNVQMTDMAAAAGVAAFGAKREYKATEGGFAYIDFEVALEGATKREDDTLVFFTMSAVGVLSPATPFAFPAIPAGQGDGADDIYGFAMQSDPATGRLFALANFKSGHVFQWEVTATGGQLALTFVRGLKVGSQPEGMVSDDAGGMIYVGEEDVGVWRFAGDPDGSTEAVAVDRVGAPCLPVDDVEGLGIHDAGGKRHLVVSAQGIDKAAIYRLDGLEVPVCVGLVGIGAGAIDGVSETDGLDVASAPLPGSPEGVLVMMDDQNAGYTTNFKLISWADVRGALGL